MNKLVQLPGWLRKEIAEPEPADSERWSVMFFPPKPWIRQARKTPGFSINDRSFIWRPTDQTLPIPDNPNLWIDEDPVIVAGWPGVDASEYHRLVAALQKVVHELDEMLSGAIQRASQAGREPLSDPTCHALMSALTIMQRRLGGHCKTP